MIVLFIETNNASIDFLFSCCCPQNTTGPRRGHAAVRLCERPDPPRRARRLQDLLYHSRPRLRNTGLEVTISEVVALEDIGLFFRGNSILGRFVSLGRLDSERFIEIIVVDISNHESFCLALHPGPRDEAPN